MSQLKTRTFKDYNFIKLFELNFEISLFKDLKNDNLSLFIKNP